jgi:hypothetical protein
VKCDPEVGVEYPEVKSPTKPKMMIHPDWLGEGPMKDVGVGY